jgi:small subunit ribosomal protein S3
LGQKTHPIGFRLGIIRTWNSRWYAEKNFANLLYEDMMIRRYLKKRLGHASLANVGIERTVKEVTVNIFTARPGVVIGKKGEEVERIKGELQHLTGKDIYINIREIKRPEVDSMLVAENIARQLEKRVAFRRAMKKAVSSAMRLGAQGIKIQCGGRLGGAEIARVEKTRDGRIPLQTLRADIDYAQARARPPTGPSASRCGSSRARSSRRTRWPMSRKKKGPGLNPC